MSLEQITSNQQDSPLQWESKSGKASKEKKLTASTSIGVYDITWNTQDHVPVYDLYFQGDFLISDTAIKALYEEALNHYNGKILYSEYIKK